MAATSADAGAQVGVRSSRHVTTRPQQENRLVYEDEMPIIKTVEDENTALEDLRTAGFRILEREGTHSIIEMSNIIVLALLKNKYPGDNNDVAWKKGIEDFVECLRRVVDLRINEEQTRPVLRRLRLNIVNIFRGCVECLLNMESYEEKCKFILGVFIGDYVEQLQNAYFDEQFCEKVKSLPVDFAPDGCILSSEQRATISEFFQLILEKLTITVWLELDQIHALLNEDFASKSPLTIKATITLTSMTAKVEEVSHFSPVLQPSINNLKKSGQDSKNSDLGSALSITEDGEESATVSIVRSTVTELIQKYLKFVDKVLTPGKDLMEVEPGESFDDDYLECPMTENVEVQLSGNSEMDIDALPDTDNVDDLKSMVTRLIGEKKRYQSQLKDINNPTSKDAYEARVEHISTLGEQIASAGREISSEMLLRAIYKSEEDKESMKLRANELVEFCEELNITTTELVMCHQDKGFTKWTKPSDD